MQLDNGQGTLLTNAPKSLFHVLICALFKPGVSEIDLCQIRRDLPCWTLDRPEGETWEEVEDDAFEHGSVQGSVTPGTLSCERFMSFLTRTLRSHKKVTILTPRMTKREHGTITKKADPHLKPQRAAATQKRNISWKSFSQPSQLEQATGKPPHKHR